MQWWAWLGTAWVALAFAAGLWVGAAAKLAGARERAARLHQYEDEAAKHQRAWEKAG